MDNKIIIKKNVVEQKITLTFSEIERIVLYASRISEIVTKDNKKIEIDKYLDKRDELLNELGDSVKVKHYPIFEKRKNR